VEHEELALPPCPLRLGIHAAQQPKAQRVDFVVVRIAQAKVEYAVGNVVKSFLG